MGKRTEYEITNVAGVRKILTGLKGITELDCPLDITISEEETLDGKTISRVEIVECGKLTRAELRQIHETQLDHLKEKIKALEEEMRILNNEAKMHSVIDKALERSVEDVEAYQDDILNLVRVLRISRT